MHLMRCVISCQDMIKHSSINVTDRKGKLKKYNDLLSVSISVVIVCV